MIYALVALTMLSAGGDRCRYRDGGRIRNCIDAPGGGGENPPLFSWLTTSTTYDTSEELCDVIPVGKKTGNYWCQYGDGTMDPLGATTIAGSGVISTLSRRHCPNGPDCTAKNGKLMNLGQYDISNGGRSNDTDFTVCSYSTIAESPSYWSLASRVTTYAVNGQYGLYYTSGSIVARVLYSTGAVSDTTASANNNVDMPRLICMTFTSGAANTSVVKLYLDGTLAASTTAQPTTAGIGTSSFDQIGADYQTTAGQVRGLLYGTAYIPDDLTAGEIAAMTARVYASVLTADTGTAPVYTATSPTACAHSDVNVTIVPINGPCIRDTSAEIWNAATNLLAYSTNPALAPWTDASGGSYVAATVTSYASTSPSGVPSGTQLTDGSGAGYAGRQQTASATTPTKYTLSCYLRGALGTETGRLRLTGTGDSTGDNECTAALTTAWQRISCVSPAAYAGTLTQLKGTVASGAVVGDTQTIYVWGCQLEEGDTASPVIVTLGAAATRAAPTLQSVATYTVDGTPALAADVKRGRVEVYNTFVNLRDTATVGGIMQSNSPGNQTRYFADIAGAAQPAIASGVGTWYHVRGYTVGSNNTCYQDATTDTVGGAGASTSYGTIDIGTGFGSFGAVSGQIKNVCVANAETTCP